MKVAEQGRKLAAFCRRVEARLADASMRPWIVVLWMFGVFSLADVPGMPVLTFPLWLQWVVVVCIGFLKALLWGVLYEVCRKIRVARIAVIAGMVLFALLSVINTGCYLLYGFGITHRLLVVVAQTNGREIAEFLPGLGANLLQIKNIALFLGAAVVMAGLCVSVKHWPRRVWQALCGLLTVGAVAGLVWLTFGIKSGKSYLTIYGRTAKYAIDVYKENRAFANRACKGVPFPNPEKLQTKASEITVVLVLGESASREALSVYGYPLVTTPYCAAMRDSLYIFRYAIGCSTSTAMNIERILTFEEDSAPDGSWYRYPALIDMLKKSRFKTFWLSNQERTGLMSNNSGVMAEDADVVEYVGAQSSEDQLMAKYDTELLPYFGKAMADTAPRKFIFLHLLGSHVEYSNRYPASCAYFTADSVLAKIRNPWLNWEKAQTVAQYANSVRFTDALLGNIINVAATEQRPVVVIYFSDHGENVYTDRDFIGRDPKFVEIPFIVYTNAAYRRMSPAVIDMMRAGVERPFTTANVIYTLMTLSGISHPLYDATKDVLSPHFLQRPRYVDGKIFQAR